MQMDGPRIVSCFDIGESPRSPGKLNWNRLSFLTFIFIFEQCECGRKQITIGVSVDKDANGSPRGSPNGSVSSVLFCCDELTFGA